MGQSSQKYPILKIGATFGKVNSTVHRKHLRCKKAFRNSEKNELVPNT